MSDQNHSCVVDVSTLDDVETALHTIMKSLDIRFVMRGPETPTLSTPMQKDLKNGDCMFFCCWMILECLGAQRFGSASDEEMATFVRSSVFEYIEAKWEKKGPNDMLWHDLITHAHNVGVTPEETQQYGLWGSSARDRLASWKLERDSFFGGPTEFLAFVYMAYESNIPLQIRIWKNLKGVLTRCYEVEWPTYDTARRDALIVADVKHIGRMDTSKAHMRLIASGAFKK
jgi:hypothetical protein